MPAGSGEGSRRGAYERIRKARSFKEFTDAEGALERHRPRARSTPAAAFRAAHGPIVDEMFKAARAEGRREPYEAYAFDAFIELARRAANPSPAEPRPEPTAAPRHDDSERSPRPRAKQAEGEGDPGAASRDHPSRSQRAADAARSRATSCARSPASGPIPVSRRPRPAR